LINAFYKKQKQHKNYPFFSIKKKETVSLNYNKRTGSRLDSEHASHAFVWARLCPSKDSMADLAAESAPTCHVKGSAGDGRNGAVA
jgi:hypothetical protein